MTNHNSNTNQIADENLSRDIEKNSSENGLSMRDNCFVREQYNGDCDLEITLKMLLILDESLQGRTHRLFMFQYHIDR